MNWLEEHLATCSLSEEAESYALSRGARPETIREFGLVSWEPLPEPAPDEVFIKRYGERGEWIEDWLICPLTIPLGNILGFEARKLEEKKITQFKLMPRALWNPIWIGCHRSMGKIWGGCTIWVGEGQFDVYALEWAAPPEDAVLGSLRAKLTPAHVDFLRRASLRGCRVKLVWDEDESGRKGVEGWTDDTGKDHWGALKQLKRVGVECEDTRYTGGGDPGEIWDQGGAEAVIATFR